jgi:hypothetical protein
VCVTNWISFLVREMFTIAGDLIQGAHRQKLCPFKKSSFRFVMIFFSFGFYRLVLLL